MVATTRQGTVYLVGAGPGDPGLITLRGIEYLQQADVVVYDRLASRSLLAYAPAKAELIDVGKQPKRHRVPQEEINAILIEKARQGHKVVRLKGGDPFVFGRGGEEALVLAEAGLRFEVVPGVTSAIAAPAYAGIPLTHRGVACSAALATGHRASFVKDPTCDWSRLATGADTLVFLMGVANLPRIVEQLIANGRPPDTPVALVERASRTDQKTIVGVLSNIVERSTDLRPPAAIVVGEVVRLRDSLRWFDRPDQRPLLGLRILNTRPLEQTSELSRRLMELGAEPVELPVTQVAPVEDTTALDVALNHLLSDGPYWHWIIFTSANNVSFFMQRCLERGYDARLLAGVKLAALGKTTVETLGQYGLKADLIPTGYNSRDIAAELGQVARQRILLPQSTLAGPELKEALQAQGATVESVVTYTVVPARPDPIGLPPLLAGEIDAAIFISPSGLGGLAAMLDEKPITETLSGLTVACIGPVTAQTAQEMGIRVDIVPKTYTIEGLVEAIVNWYNR